MPASAPVVDVDIASTADGIPSATAIRDWVKSALDVSRQPAAAAEVSVRIVEEAEMRTLNRDFRQQDKSTNVLSFPAGAIVGLPADADQLLGDIVVCAPVVAREAAEQGKQLPHHWAHMVVHGVLHLLGYDHQSDEQAADMEALEKQALERHGIGNPYGAPR
jgi:probable rRNA maturation factor